MKWRDSWIYLSSLTVFIIIQAGVCAHAQSTSYATIAEPRDGTIVQPGQTLHVSVNTRNVKELGLLTTDNIASAALQPGAPNMQFSVHIPLSVRPGAYQLTAVGSSDMRGLVRSNSVVIVVPVGELTSIEIDDASVTLPLPLPFPGAQTFLSVLGISNGRKQAIEKGLTFRSANPAIATVDEFGTVTGQSTGTTIITASYVAEGKLLASSTAVSIGGSVRGDLNNDGRVDMNDVKLLERDFNDHVNGYNDARDLNHDGKIDETDEQILKGLCGLPNCATH